MINMMYLVLTALLALNVSVEVLNAFKTVNNSIIKSNTVIDQKNQMTYDAFNEDMKDPKTMAKAQTWAPHAQEVQKLSAALSASIEQLKQRLIEESSPKKNAEGKVTEFADGNLDAATRVMDKNGEGPKLYERLKQFRNDLLAELDPAKYPNEGQKVLEDLKNQQATFAHSLPLDTHIPPSESGNTAIGSDSAHNWTIRYFHMTPTIAALTILSKFQSDVKNSESQVVDYLFKQIGEVKVVFDQFKPLISPSATYLMPGDELSVKAGIGAFSAAAKPKIYMNGTEYPVNADGTAELKTKVSSTGNIHVKIEYTKPDGSVGVSENDVKYTVGQPSGASVFLEKMNVLYVKEDNPLKISGGSVGREKVHVSFSNGEIHHGDGDEWIAVPTTPGMGKIIVEAEGKRTEFEMRIKYLPNPTGFVGTKNGGSMSSAEFKANGGLRAVLDNSEFISPFRVVGYKLAAIGGNISQYTEASNDGPRWTGQAAAIVARATPGTNIFFDDIRVMGKDGRVRALPPMVFNLK
ncbi:gliding motility protein GldM [Puia dinghuensis]|uniref:Gliding motility protein GldM n=2 Tax=Puia dinghuensis TaxID=1792502 RepID=A0A8J2UF26_9BACT|nr:gliding motility protein GldM [Puia dinghuensis]